jgi:hypothetical protein
MKALDELGQQLTMLNTLDINNKMYSRSLSRSRGAKPQHDTEIEMQGYLNGTRYPSRISR